jgi:hypothetical protein
VIDDDAIALELSSSSEESEKPGSRRPTANKQCRKSHSMRVKYPTKKRTEEEKETRRNLQLQASDKVDYEEYLRKNPSTELSLTLWSIQKGKFKPPKFDEEPRFYREKDRTACALDEQGRMVGTGSFYKRPYDATWEELNATQGRLMRVRTANLRPSDQINRELKGDDSDQESDWLNRTGHPVFHVKPLEARKAPNWSSFVVTKDYQNIKLPSAVAKEVSRRSKVQKRAAEELEKNPAAKSK